jgi:hypothetical protein
MGAEAEGSVAADVKSESGAVDEDAEMEAFFASRLQKGSTHIAPHDTPQHRAAGKRASALKLLVPPSDIPAEGAEVQPM